MLMMLWYFVFIINYAMQLGVGGGGVLMNIQIGYSEVGGA